MENYEKLRELVNNMEKDIIKFGEKNNKSAGVRIRKDCQTIKDMCQKIRVEISSKNKE
jgi:hypothetical protein